MSGWRLGVALMIPEPFACEINGLRKGLGDGSIDRIAPHMTLVPPVNVRVGNIGRTLAVIRHAAETLQSFSVTLGPVSTFAPDTPVIKLGIAENDVDGLAQVQRLRDAVFVQPLARQLTWPFVPHVTLADEAHSHRIDCALTALAGYQVTVEFSSVHLLRQHPVRRLSIPLSADNPASSIHLLREGVHRSWAAIADFGFRRPSVVGRGSLPTELTVTQLVDPKAVELANDAAASTNTDLVVTGRRQDEVVGVIGGVSRGVDLRIQLLSVADGHRNQGVGRALVAEFVSEANRVGYESLSLGELNSDCAEFLKNHGFTEGIRYS